jgi:nucleoid-associated protein YgaU
MGNFEKLSVLVIVVIIVMILVVAIHTWTSDPEGPEVAAESAAPAERTVVSEPPTPARTPNATPEPANDWLAELERLEREREAAKGEDQKASAPKSEKPEADTPAPAPAPAEPQSNWNYTVKSGDTVSHIAERELGTFRRQRDILALNPDLDPRMLREGQVLVMPPRQGATAATTAAAAPSTPAGPAKAGEPYTVRAGDRLSTISKRAYGTIERWPDIWARNLALIRDPDNPAPGTQIILPR